MRMIVVISSVLCPAETGGDGAYFEIEAEGDTSVSQGLILYPETHEVLTELPKAMERYLGERGNSAEEVWVAAHRPLFDEDNIAKALKNKFPSSQPKLISFHHNEGEPPRDEILNSLKVGRGDRSNRRNTHFARVEVSD